MRRCFPKRGDGTEEGRRGGRKGGRGCMNITCLCGGLGGRKMEGGVIGKG